MMINTSTLDHIVHLTPPGSVEEVSEQFRGLGFQVLPGGTHVGGLTANALVVLEDGVYLELISFTHPQSHYPPGSPERKQRDSNPWSTKSPGWIDFAFLGNGSHTHSVSKCINERGRVEGSGVLYSPEQDGGRVRKDGQALKWLISGPQELKDRGILPFFCGDITPRSLRVPSDPPKNTQHPSTATGIAFVRILVTAPVFGAVSNQLTSVLGKRPLSTTDELVTWELETVNQSSTAGAGGHPHLLLALPSDESEAAFLQQLDSDSGIYEIGFWVKDSKKKKGTEFTPYGKITWVEAFGA